MIFGLFDSRVVARVMLFDTGRWYFRRWTSKITCSWIPVVKGNRMGSPLTEN
jgi:hypothetical protein